MRDLYTTIWLLRIEGGVHIIEKLEIGGRALQTTNIHERIMELLTRVYSKVFEMLTPRKIVELVNVQEGIKIAYISEFFFSSLDAPRITDENVVRKAILRGVKEKLFGLTTEERVQIVQDRMKVAKEHVIINRDIPDDEIDMDSGFIVLPSVITFPEEKDEKEEKKVDEKKEKERIEEEKEEKEESKIFRITYSFKADRSQLYKCFNALANLAEKSGKINLKVETELEEGIDSHWLRNAVEEPIEESGVKIERG